MREVRIVLDGYGSFLGMEKGCYVVRDKHGDVERYPMFENLIGEVVLKSGNTVSTGALTSMGWWEIDVLLLTRKGRPVAYLKSLDDDSHVKTRLKQYEAYNDRDKSLYIAKHIILSKLEGQNMVLNCYGLKPHKLDYKHKIEALKPNNYRSKLSGIEGRYSRNYFEQIIKLLPEKIRPETRKKYQAYDGMNNLFNLAYEVLGWRIHRALIKAHLEPFLGFLHSMQYSKPSLVCDFKELYRYLIDVFVIHYSQGLTEKDFTVKTEKVSRKRMGKREYLKESKTRDMIRKLYDYLETKVEIPRIKHGKNQSITTLINEESLLLASYIRGKNKSWKPRIAEVSYNL